jgi:hypothetical protein
LASSQVGRQAAHVRRQLGARFGRADVGLDADPAVGVLGPVVGARRGLRHVVRAQPRGQQFQQALPVFLAAAGLGEQDR